ncbi:hypothetical protein BB561_000587 [Smittium simulii]|uniref:RING-type domain-containing protein n=1 Tax=Smittium simulii TaxID=133385 RepID=A0A2T9YYF4_9FUNG|nr:hypothetical protein BB561_000587 [Smittium simulii]
MNFEVDQNRIPALDHAKIPPSASTHQNIYLELHKGHDFQHFLISVLILSSLFLSPILIKYWKRKSYKSYQIANLLIISVFPPLFALSARFYRFIFWCPLQVSSLFITLFEYNLVILYYALYFGLDLVNICIDKLSTSLGYYSVSGIPFKSLPSNICSICGLIMACTNEETTSDASNAFHQVTTDTHNPICTLDCKHKFHSNCIRGWCLIGKRNICPYW